MATSTLTTVPPMNTQPNNRRAVVLREDEDQYDSLPTGPYFLDLVPKVLPSSVGSGSPVSSGTGSPVSDGSVGRGSAASTVPIIATTGQRRKQQYQQQQQRRGNKQQHQQQAHFINPAFRDGTIQPVLIVEYEASPAKQSSTGRYERKLSPQPDQICDQSPPLSTGQRTLPSFRLTKNVHHTLAKLSSPSNVVDYFYCTLPRARSTVHTPNGSIQPSCSDTITPVGTQVTEFGLCNTSSFSPFASSSNSTFSSSPPPSSTNLTSDMPSTSLSSSLYYVDCSTMNPNGNEAIDGVQLRQFKSDRSSSFTSTTASTFGPSDSGSEVHFTVVEQSSALPLPPPPPPLTSVFTQPTDSLSSLPPPPPSLLMPQVREEIINVSCSRTGGGTVTPESAVDTYQQLTTLRRKHFALATSTDNLAQPQSNAASDRSTPHSVTNSIEPNSHYSTVNILRSFQPKPSVDVECHQQTHHQASSSSTSTSPILSCSSSISSSATVPYGSINDSASHQNEMLASDQRALPMPPPPPSELQHTHWDPMELHAQPPVSSHYEVNATSVVFARNCSPTYGWVCQQDQTNSAQECASLGGNSVDTCHSSDSRKRLSRSFDRNNNSNSHKRAHQPNKHIFVYKNNAFVGDRCDPGANSFDMRATPLGGICHDGGLEEDSCRIKAKISNDQSYTMFMNADDCDSGRQKGGPPLTKTKKDVCKKAASLCADHWCVRCTRNMILVATSVLLAVTFLVIGATLYRHYVNHQPETGFSFFSTVNRFLFPKTTSIDRLPVSVNGSSSTTTTTPFYYQSTVASVNTVNTSAISVPSINAISAINSTANQTNFTHHQDGVSGLNSDSSSDSSPSSTNTTPVVSSSTVPIRTLSMGSTMKSPAPTTSVSTEPTKSTTVTSSTTPTLSPLTSAPTQTSSTSPTVISPPTAKTIPPLTADPPSTTTALSSPQSSTLTSTIPTSTTSTTPPSSTVISTTTTKPSSPPTITTTSQTRSTTTTIPKPLSPKPTATTAKPIPPETTTTPITTSTTTTTLSPSVIESSQNPNSDQNSKSKVPSLKLLDTSKPSLETPKQELAVSVPEKVDTGDISLESFLNGFPQKQPVEANVTKSGNESVPVDISTQTNDTRLVETASNIDKASSFSDQSEQRISDQMTSDASMRNGTLDLDQSSSSIDSYTLSTPSGTNIPENIDNQTITLPYATSQQVFDSEPDGANIPSTVQVMVDNFVVHNTKPSNSDTQSDTTLPSTIRN